MRKWAKLIKKFLETKWTDLIKKIKWADLIKKIFLTKWADLIKKNFKLKGQI